MKKFVKYCFQFINNHEMSISGGDLEEFGPWTGKWNVVRSGIGATKEYELDIVETDGNVHGFFGGMALKGSVKGNTMHFKYAANQQATFLTKVWCDGIMMLSDDCMRFSGRGSITADRVFTLSGAREDLTDDEDVCLLLELDE